MYDEYTNFILLGLDLNDFIKTEIIWLLIEPSLKCSERNGELKLYGKNAPSIYGEPIYTDHVLSGGPYNYRSKRGPIFETRHRNYAISKLVREKAVFATTTFYFSWAFRNLTCAIPTDNLPIR